MQVHYTYTKPSAKLKNKDTVKLKLFSLNHYDCQFISVDVKTKEGKRILTSSVMIPVKTKADIDALIKELELLKEYL